MFYGVPLLIEQIVGKPKSALTLTAALEGLVPKKEVKSKDTKHVPYYKKGCKPWEN